MKATRLLEHHHRKVESLLSRIEKGEDPASNLKELARDLAAHMAIEQDIFYPLVLEAKPDLINASYEEHALAEVALKRLLATHPREVTFTARARALREVLEHHIDQEEHELFPAVEAVLGIDRLEVLGEELERAYKEAQSEGFEALAGPSFAVTSADEARKELAEAERPGAGANAPAPTSR